MRSTTWTNADGLTIGFGPANTKNLEAGDIEVKGNVRQIQMGIYYDQDVTAESVKTAVIPAGASILSASVVVKTAFVGGTALDVGTINTDGTSADVDSLVDNSLTAALTLNARIAGAGVLVGAVTANDVNITYATTGAFTAGEATLFVEYLMPTA